jgi:hypothetical protein
MSKLTHALHTASIHSRMPRLMLAATAAAAAALPIAAAPASASADTLVYVKNGTVYLAQPDGTQARPITTTSNDWAWPSETDAGIIAVAGGLPRTDGSFNPSGSDEIFEFNQQGAQVAGPVPTARRFRTRRPSGGGRASCSSRTTGRSSPATRSMRCTTWLTVPPQAGLTMRRSALRPLTRWSRRAAA